MLDVLNSSSFGTPAAWSALFLVALVATADEARQAFSTARSGSPYDVLIDVAGGAVAIAALLVISWRMRRPNAATLAD